MADQQHESGTPRVMVEVIARLDKQVDLAESLLAVARGQAGHIAAGNADELLEVLARRQTLIDDLLSAQNDLSPFTEGGADPVRSASKHDRGRVRARVERIRTALTTVAEIDDADRGSLESRLKTLAAERATNDAARSANDAYRRARSNAPTTTTTTRFTDQQG